MGLYSAPSGCDNSTMVASIIFGTLFSMACVIAMGAWLCYLIATVGRPKRAPAPAPTGEFYDETVVRAKVATLPPLKRTPTYRPRWGHYRTHSVETQKASWDEDFDRLLR